MSENIKKSLLDELYSDSGAFDKEAMVKVLKNLVTIQRSTNAIHLKDTKLTSEEKIFAYALAKHLLGDEGELTPDEAGISALEIKQNLGINKNTVDVTFKLLKDQRMIIPTGRKVGKEVKYIIPVYNFSKIIERLSKKSI